MHAFGARFNRPMHDLDYNKPSSPHSSKKLKNKSKSN